MTTMQIGKPNYNRTSTEKLTYFRLGMKDNQRELTLLIAPPIKSMAEKGEFAAYIKQHFGYSIPVKDKPVPMTFCCIERQDRNKNIIQECPECNEISLRNASMEAMEAKLKVNGTPSEVVDAQLRPQREWKKSHNLDRKWNLLAKNESGTWGILTLSHTAFKDLQREVADLRKQGVEEPIGVNGVWFRFTRTGASFNDIKDTCKAVQVRDGKSFTLKEGALLDSDLSALEALPELTSLGRKLSFDQIKLLVESGGDEQVVQSVFNAGQRQETSSVRTNAPSTTVQVPVQNQTVQTVQMSAPAPVSVSVPAQAPVDNSQQAVLMAQLKTAQDALAKLQANPAQNQSQSQSQQKVTPQMQTQLDMDPDEFMAKFGN